MKRLSLLFIIPLTTLSLSSCVLDQKDNSIERLEELVLEVEAMQNVYSEAEWQEVEVSYLLICEEQLALYKHELTPTEKKKINDLIGKYNAIKVKRDIKNLKNDALDFAEQAKSFINELAEDQPINKE